MPILVDCQDCGRKLRVPDDLLGRKVKCPTCGNEFEAREAEPPPPPPVVDLSGGEAAVAPLAEAPEKTKICPGCGRALPRAAFECPHCDESVGSVEPDDRPWEKPHGGLRRDIESDRGSLILTLGILSLFLPLVGPVLGVTAWVMAIQDMGRMRAGQLDPQGMGNTQAGMICGIIGTFLQGTLSFCCVMPCMWGLIAGN